MSDTETVFETPPDAVAVPVPVELAVPLAAFAAIVGPRVGETVVVRNGASVRIRTLLPGQPDEVWLKLLAIRHPNGRYTMTEWQRLIEQYRHEPAHPADPEYGRVN